MPTKELLLTKKIMQRAYLKKECLISKPDVLEKFETQCFFNICILQWKYTEVSIVNAHGQWWRLGNNKDFILFQVTLILKKEEKNEVHQKTKQEKCLPLCIAGDKNTGISHKLWEKVCNPTDFSGTYFFLLNLEKLCDKNYVNYTKVRFSALWIKRGT